MSRNRIQTIQQTGKPYKGAMALGVLAILFGGFLSLFGTAPGLGGVVITAGILTYLIAKILAWWNHG